MDTLEDTLAEADETFTLMLTLSDPPANVTLRQAAAEATITDDDILMASVVGPENVAEGTVATFTVTLSDATSTADVVLGYTVGGNAVVDVDYQAPSETLTIPRGRASGTILIQTIANGTPGETLLVELARPVVPASTVGTVQLVQGASSPKRR